VPSAVLCHLLFGAFCRFVRLPFCAFCRFVRLPFCASAVMFYAVLCVCRFVRLPFRDLPFCMCIIIIAVFASKH
jgi:hypothetical protein